MEFRLGFIGGGMMAEAMLGGLFKAGMSPDNVIISEPFEQRRKYMADTFKVKVTLDNTEVCQASDVVVMAVKPQVLEAVLADLQKKAAQNPKVETIMGSCGIVERVAKEELLDAVTGLSGGGPAYAYLLIEAMSDGGVRMGLPRATATRLAAQTVMGAGKMVVETGKHPGELKDNVTSPGGTTIAGVQALEVGGYRGSVINAVEAATKRSQELGKL